MAAVLYISSSTSLALVDTQTGAKTVYLPDSKYLYGKSITIKDSGGSSAGNPITIRPFSNDVFETGGSIQNINTNYGSLTFVAGQGKWYALQSISGTGTVTGINPGVSSLSSIVAYGLSSVVVGATNSGVSSLSSIVSYGLSSINGAQGISSLSSIVAFGLSSLLSNITFNLSTLSTSYGQIFNTSTLSTINIAAQVGFISTLSITNLTVNATTNTNIINANVFSTGTFITNIISTNAIFTSSIMIGASDSILDITGPARATTFSTFYIDTSTINATTAIIPTAFISSLNASTINVSTLVAQLVSTPQVNVSSIQMGSFGSIIDVTGPLRFTTGSTINFYASSIMANGLQLGTTSNTSIFFDGIASTYDRTTISELALTGSNQELLLYKGGGSTDRVRIQTTGEFRVESGVGARTWPNIASVVPTLYAGITGQVGINTETPGATLDVVGAFGPAIIRTNVLSSQQLFVSSIFANTLTGDGSQLSNIGVGVSSLSSIVSYGLSTVFLGINSPINPGVSSLSSIVAYGLSTVFLGINSPINPGVSSLSSIVSYGLSSVNAGQGTSSLSSIVSYGLSSVNGGQGISTLSSIVSYGLSSVNGGQGISSLSSIVAYGLSSVASGATNPGVSSLSSIVSYGLSSVNGGQGISSLSSIVSYGLSSVNGGQGISSLSSIVSYGLSSVASGATNPGVSSLSSIISYGLSSVNGGQGISSLSSIVAYGLSTLQQQPAPGVSSLSSIVSYGLSSVNGGQGVSSLSSIVAYGLSTVSLSISANLSSFSTSYGQVFRTSSIIASNIITTQATISSLTVDGLIFGTGDGFVDFDAVRSVVISSIQENTESLYATTGYIGTTSNLNAIFFAGLSNTYDRTVIAEISTATVGAQELLLYKGGGSTDRVRIQTTGEFRVESGVSTRTWPNNVSVVPTLYAGTNGQVGINTATPGVTLDVVGSAGAGTIRTNILSSQQLFVSSIFALNISGDGSQLSNIGVGVSSLSSIVSYGLSSVNGGQGISSLSSIIAYGLSTAGGSAINPGVSSLSSIVAYGLSSINGGQGISSLSSIVSYGLSSVAGGQGTSSLSSIVSYGLSSINGGQGISSLSSIVSYGLSSVNGGQGVSSLSSIVSYGLSSVNGGQGVSSLSSIVAYGLSTVSLSISANLSSFSTSYAQVFRTSSIIASNIIASQATISSLTVNTLTFGAGDGFVDFGAVRSVVISSIQENTGSLYATTGYIGTTSNLNAIFFAGLSNTYDRTVIGEISTATVGAQELLLYKGGGSTDRVRIQTTGEFRIESGVSTRTWPNNVSVVPTLYAGTNGQVGINTATPAVTLDVVGSAGAGTIRTNILSSQQLFVSSIFALNISGDGSQLSNIGVGVSSLSSIVAYGLSSVNGGQGISSLSSIIAYGLSTAGGSAINPGVSSLSSIVAYGLSSINGGQGISSLSSIVAYGLSTIARQPDVGLSSLSSIVAYGLSSVAGGQGISSLSSIVSYGLSSVVGGQGISSLSSIVAYGLSSVNGGQGVSSLSSIVAYGLSTVSLSISANLSSFSTSYAQVFRTSSIIASNIIASQATISSLTVNTLTFGAGDGFVDFGAVRSVVISSIQENTGSLYATTGYIGTNSNLNAIFFAGLSNTYDRTVIGEISTATVGAQELLLYKGGGSTDRVRIQTTGEFRVESGVSTRTWPNNVSVVPTLYAGTNGQVGINTATPGVTLDVVGSVGAGTIRTNILSSQQLFVSSIFALNISGDGSQLSNIGVGVSSLSSIVSYGLSSVNGGQGISSLSSIIAYGLSTIRQQPAPGVSSLSSIVAYGLSSVNGGQGISSLSSIIAYGLSTIRQQPSPGVSSLSSIVAYGLSSVNGGQGISSLSSIVAYGLSSTQYISSNTLNHIFIRSSIGGTDINDGTSRPGLDTITDAFAKIDTVFERLISKPPAPVLWTNATGNKSNIIGLNYLSLTFSNLPQYYFNGQLVPDVIYTEYSLSYSNSSRPTTNPYSNTNLFTIRTPAREFNQGSFWLTGINSNITATTFVLNISSNNDANYYRNSNESDRFYNEYNLNRFSNYDFSSFNPYLFKMRWINNASYPITDDYFTTYINFAENVILSGTDGVQ